MMRGSCVEKGRVVSSSSRLLREPDDARGGSRSRLAVGSSVSRRCGFVKSVIESYLRSSKADADAYFDMDWDSETSRVWESARMTREDFELVNVVQPHRAPVEA
jgi:hypothetical protein